MPTIKKKTFWYTQSMAWMSVDPCKTLSKVAKPRGSSLALKKNRYKTTWIYWYMNQDLNNENKSNWRAHDKSHQFKYPTHCIQELCMTNNMQRPLLHNIWDCIKRKLSSIILRSKSLLNANNYKPGYLLNEKSKTWVLISSLSLCLGSFIV